MAWTGDFLIKVYSPNGVYQQAFFYPFKKAPFSRHEISDEIIKTVAQKMPLPKTWPALHSMKMDNQNRLWVSTIVKNPKVYQWWILNKKGKLLARFRWPRSKPIEMVKNGCIYTTERNKKGLPQVVRYKILMQ